jgi:hypothetical protein
MASPATRLPRFNASTELFQTTSQNITLHLKEPYAEGELDEAVT